MDCEEPHLMLNENTQPIQWTEWPTSALVAAGSLWPFKTIHQENLTPNQQVLIFETIP